VVLQGIDAGCIIAFLQCAVGSRFLWNNKCTAGLQIHGLSHVLETIRLQKCWRAVMLVGRECGPLLFMSDSCCRQPEQDGFAVVCL
jgi:hypothetical protein